MMEIDGSDEEGEMRNSKREFRKKPEGENSKLETEGIDCFESFLISGFLQFRLELFSDFEFLVSSFPDSPPHPADTPIVTPFT